MLDMEYLNESEKSQLRQFADNKLMHEAVKKIMLRGMYYEGMLQADPMQNFILASVNDTFSDAQLGTIVRARAEAVRILDRAFKIILTYKKVEDMKIKHNPAL